jgi:hypothetical protein
VVDGILISEMRRQVKDYMRLITLKKRVYFFRIPDIQVGKLNVGGKVGSSRRQVIDNVDLIVTLGPKPLY